MISNMEMLATDPAQTVALDCLEAAIEAADPENAAAAALGLDGDVLTIGECTYDLGSYDEVVVVGAGKAAGGVTRALETVLGDRITDGLAVTKSPAETETVRTVTGDHPIPSRRNVEATASLLDVVDAATERTLVLFVLTGGASALLSAPAGDLSLGDLRETTRRLLEGGVPIGEVNAVRKHLSAVKGGRLARRAAPATVEGILVSDVVGNDPSTIGSGPTVPDETTYSDALAVVEERDLELPAAVLEHLRSGDDGRLPETPGSDDDSVNTVANHVIADNATALAAARAVAEEAGYEAMVLTTRLRGEAREVAKPLVAVGEEAATRDNPVSAPAVVLAGGETTVTVTGEGGSGGPNQELVLSAALELEADLTIAAVDTDGEDGSSDAAGAIADARTVPDREHARTHLTRNDAGAYLAEVDATIETGPTATNVNDVVAVVVPEPDS